jgi:hypothetical protein
MAVLLRVTATVGFANARPLLKMEAFRKSGLGVNLASVRDSRIVETLHGRNANWQPVLSGLEQIH